jgi:hypothetical protein
MSISNYAGKAAEPWMLTNIPRLVTAYYVNRPDPGVMAQRVAFGTSGHRGSSLDHAFNEAHILAITQAICLYRKQQVLAANGVEVMVDAAGGSRRISADCEIHWVTCALLPSFREGNLCMAKTGLSMWLLRVAASRGPKTRQEERT